MNTYMLIVLVLYCTCLVQSDPLRNGVINAAADDECDPAASCKDCFAQNFTYCLKADRSPLCCKERSGDCSSEIFTPDKCATENTTTTSPTSPSTVSSSTSPPSTASTPEVSSVTPSSTVLPTRPPSRRHFDAPSFIGGIVLSLGLLAIVYVSFKFYKARTERNYHTL